MVEMDEPLVGGRLEPVAPRRVTDAGDRLRLAALLTIALISHGWVLTHTKATARDSIGFARIALQLESPHAADFKNHAEVLQNAQHPPGYPLAVLAASAVVRQVYPAALPDQMLVSAQVASAIAAVLLVFPTYALGRMLFGKFVGFASALMMQILPVVAHITTDGLTEGVYLLGLGTALMFGVRAVRSPSIGGFLLCGLATGATYLVRPEGLLVGAAVGAVVLVLFAVRRWTLTSASARLTALAVGALIPAAPYMILIGGITNKPSASGILDGLIPNIRSATANASVAPVGSGTTLFAARWVEGKDEAFELWVPHAIFKESTKAFHFGPAVFALLGLGVAAGRVRKEPWLAVPAVLGGGVLSVLTILAFKSGYISERHTLPLVYAGIFYAAAGMEAVPRIASRFVSSSSLLAHPAVGSVLLAIVAGSCIPQLIKAQHRNREGHKYVGAYLRDHADDGDTIIDPFEWAAFYSERSLRSIPPDPPPLAGHYRWAVIEQGDSPHSFLPRYQAAVDVASDTRNKAIVAYYWPENAQPQFAQVVVFRQEIPVIDEAVWRSINGSITAFQVQRQSADPAAPQ